MNPHKETNQDVQDLLLLPSNLLDKGPFQRAQATQSGRMIIALHRGYRASQEFPPIVSMKYIQIFDNVV